MQTRLIAAAIACAAGAASAQTTFTRNTPVYRPAPYVYINPQHFQQDDINQRRIVEPAPAAYGEVRTFTRTDTGVPPYATTPVTATNGAYLPAAATRWGIPGDPRGGHIAINTFDGTFLIDPFVQIPTGKLQYDYDDVRRFRNSRVTLDRDHAFYGGRTSYDNFVELMSTLEHERQRWLREQGFTAVRTLTNPNAAAFGTEVDVHEIQPIMRIERPAELPRTRSRESVDATPSSGVFTEPGVRWSVPPTFSTAAAQRLSTRGVDTGTDAVASR